MNRWKKNYWLVVVLAILVPILVMSQAKIESLSVAGHPGSIPVKTIDGQHYVEVESLVQLAGGSIAFHGEQITLTLPAAEAIPATQAKAGLSRGFQRASIDEMIAIRDWHTALATAIENQYAVVPTLIHPYETRATKNLRLAQVAATTEDDQSAAQVLTDAYGMMKQLSDNYLAKRAAATYINADSLASDTLNQSLLACEQSLGAMYAGGQFTNSGACR